MLFSSYAFIFAFLPVCLAGFYALARIRREWAEIYLIFASLLFYGWWSLRYVPLLAGSIAVNYWVGSRIQASLARGYRRRVTVWCSCGVLANVALLVYFKYSNFLVENVNLLLGTEFTLQHIILPLGISFYSFQNIAYLTDCARGQIKQPSLIAFALFGVFFPKLIAGPIVHYNEVYPQFEMRRFVPTAKRNLMVGLVIFAIGLFKKTVVADTAGSIATPFYEMAARGHAFDMFTGWLAASSYTVQLYFDFSGYSDMAIGIARMFGILLPLNFHSPLRATNIVEFWRRWHMTLQRFILSYIFQPLSLAFTRKAAETGIGRWPAFFISVIVPMFVTFVILGIWHGAGWTFVLYGVINAIFVCTFVAWSEHQKHRRRKLKISTRDRRPSRLSRISSHVITVLCVLTTLVIFRSDNFATAGVIYKGMFGLSGTVSSAMNEAAIPEVLIFMVLSSLIIALMPNTQQIMRFYCPAQNWRQWRDVASSLITWRWRPDAIGIVAAGIILFFGIVFIARGEVAFVYFKF
jgi:D-alanyl-lipoteichoic acid acyltransferase DltB (MBOAT superfamily)